jgi:peroxisomal membrane protein 4
MAKTILKLTYQHSRNLAFFVTIYKSLLLVQRKVKGFEHQSDSFIAGIIGGYIIFGTDNAVNQQVAEIDGRLYCIYFREFRPD